MIFSITGRTELGTKVYFFGFRTSQGSSWVKPIVLRQKLCGNFNYLGQTIWHFSTGIKGRKSHFRITSKLNTYNPLRIAFHEWIDVYKDAISLNAGMEA
jgi:hypothetical protein